MVLPQPGEPTADIKELAALADSVAAEYDSQMAAVQFSRALEAIWRFISAANRLVETSKPWVLAKDESRQQELASVMYALAESLRITSALLWPFMPAKCEALRAQLNCGPLAPPFKVKWGELEPGTRVAKGEPLFPKLLE